MTVATVAYAAAEEVTPELFRERVRATLQGLGSPDPESDMRSRAAYIERSRAEGLSPSVAAGVVYGMIHGFAGAARREDPTRYEPRHRFEDWAGEANDGFSGTIRWKSEGEGGYHGMAPSGREYFVRPSVLRVGHRSIIAWKLLDPQGRVLDDTDDHERAMLRAEHLEAQAGGMRAAEPSKETSQYIGAWLYEIAHKMSEPGTSGSKALTIRGINAATLVNAGYRPPELSEADYARGREIVERIERVAGRSLRYRELDAAVDLALTRAEHLEGGMEPSKRGDLSDDERIHMFDSWYFRHGHWIYPTRDDAWRRWRDVGIENMPDPPRNAPDTPPPTTAREDALTAARRERLPDSAFALPERRALPIHNAAHVRAAAARLSMMRHKRHVTKAEYALAHARIVAAGKRLGVEVNEPAAWTEAEHSAGCECAEPEACACEGCVGEKYRITYVLQPGSEARQAIVCGDNEQDALAALRRNMPGEYEVTRVEAAPEAPTPSFGGQILYLGPEAKEVAGKGRFRYWIFLVGKKGPIPFMADTIEQARRAAGSYAAAYRTTVDRVELADQPLPPRGASETGIHTHGAPASPAAYEGDLTWHRNEDKRGTFYFADAAHFGRVIVRRTEGPRGGEATRWGITVGQWKETCASKEAAYEAAEHYVRAPTPVLAAEEGPVAVVERTDNGEVQAGIDVDTAAQVCAVMRERKYARQGQETIDVVGVSKQGEMVGAPIEIVRGQTTRVVVEVEQILAAALALKAAGAVAVWMTHNHPSGHAHASQSDRALTKAVKAGWSRVLPNTEFKGHVVCGKSSHATA